MKLLLRLLLATALGAALLVRADVLQLKNGTVLNGKYAGGTATTVHFQTDNGLMTINAAEIVSLQVTAPVATAPSRPEAAKPSGPLTLPAGTAIMVRMMDSVSSKSAPGTNFTAKLEYDLAVSGVVAVKAGTIVYGKVQSATQARRSIGRSTLDVRLTQMVPNGSPIPLSTSSYVQRGESEGVKTAVAAGVGAIIGHNTGGTSGQGAVWGAAAASLRPGQTLTIPPGALVEFTLQQPVTIQAVR